MAFAGLVLVLCGGWVAFRSWQAYSALTDARATIAADFDLDTATLLEGGSASLRPAVTTLQEQASRARDAVDDPVFRLATALPFVGADLSAVRTIATTVDDMATQVLPPLVDLTRLADPAVLLPEKGRVDLQPFVDAAPALRHADDEVARFRGEIAAIPHDDVVGAIASAADDLAAKLDTVASVTAGAATTTELLPPMLGSDGPRRYLVLFQNLAEARSTGGMFGSYAVMTVDDGRISVGGQGATQRTIDRFDAPVAPISDDERQLYGENIATIAMDVNFTPDFPRAAELFSVMYADRIDPTPLDGAFAVDPVALGRILEGYGPVDLGGTTVAPDELAAFLLSDIYTKFPDDKDKSLRDAYTAAATGQALTALMSPPADPGAALAGLRRSVAEHRLLLWSAHPDEQSSLVRAGLTGELPAADPATAPTFGVFLADRTYLGSKLSYYLTGKVGVTAGACAADGSREATVTLDLAFDGPTSGLPEQVSGAGPKAYTLTDEFRVFAPTGGTLTGAEVDGVPVELTRGTDFGRDAGRFQTDFTPRSTSTVTLHFTVPAAGDAAAQPTVRIPPAVKNWPVTAEPFAPCG
ncbi:DUF4012 domain-containing protein [Nakamurella deserti]|uniref:DUF4012 domain-containing protein n=1 Tax=Nakamurella deserti TaxID=2164074 RepID=UPI0013008EA9|nr:DUF4012 domain-containing protein [Nakamurella deserti]